MKVKRFPGVRILIPIEYKDETRGLLFKAGHLIAHEQLHIEPTLYAIFITQFKRKPSPTVILKIIREKLNAPSDTYISTESVDLNETFSVERI